MNYALIINNEIVEYPYKLHQLRKDFPQVSFPKEIPESTLEEYGVFPVVVEDTPEYNHITQSVSPIAPTMENGAWKQGWIVEDLNLAEQQDRMSSLQNEIVAGVQNRLDTFAQSRNYDNIMSACTYASSSIPKFQAEGQQAVLLRDQTWAACYQILEDAQTGAIPMPVKYEDIEPLLPELTWEPVNGSN